MKTILLTGVSGVGKSTIANEAVRGGLRVSVRDYADLMVQRARLRDVDEIDTLSKGQRLDLISTIERDLRFSYCRDIITERLLRRKLGSEFFEDHLSIVADNQIVPFPVDDYLTRNPLGVVVVEADPEEIVKRREGDLKQRRASVKSEVLDHQQSINREIAHQLGERLRIPVLMVRNDFCHPPIGEVVNFASNVMRRYYSKDDGGEFFGSSALPLGSRV